MNSARVEVRRGGVVESVHRVRIAVVGADGCFRASAGNAAAPVFARSAIKPFQTVPLVEDGVCERFGWGSRELALACASHSGEAFHVRAVARMLERIGCGTADLACGAHPPLGATAAVALAASGEAPGRLHNNCSGKHAGMLALARLHGWPLAGYESSEHPVQRRMLAELVRWCGVAEDTITRAVDGCGVVTFGVPLDRLAAGFARFGEMVRNDPESGAARVAAAMMVHPEYVAGSGRLCTALLSATTGRVIAKVGAEGVYCAAVPAAGFGIALKVEDGALRASEPALLAVLRLVGALSVEEVETLGAFAAPVLTNTLGNAVGRIEAVVEMEVKGG